MIVIPAGVNVHLALGHIETCKLNDVEPYAYLHDVPVTLEMMRRAQREELAFEPTDQFAAELSYFSTCILQDRAPEPSGIEGLQDVRLVEAIYRSARDGRPVTLPRLVRPETVPAAEPDLRKAMLDRRQAG